MANTPKNHGKTWEKQDVQELRKLIKENTPTRVMALKLGRTPDAVQRKANDLGMSTKPTNRSPYNRRSK